MPSGIGLISCAALPHPYRKLPGSGLALFGAVFASALLVGLLAAEYFAHAAYEESVRRHTGAQRYSSTAEDLRRLLQGAESAALNYVLNGDEAQLRRFAGVRSRIEQLLRSLRENQPEGAAQSIASFDAAARALLGDLQQVIASRPVGSAPPQILTLRGPDPRISRAVHASTRQLDTTIDAHRKDRLETMSRRQKRVHLAVAVFAPFSVLLFLGSFALVMRAIRLRELAEIRLADTVAGYKAIMQGLPVPVVGRNDVDKVVLWNESAERYFGWSADDASAHAPELETPESIDAARAARGRARQGEVVSGLELTVRRRDGTSFAALAAVAPLRRYAGDVSGTVTIYADLTSIRQVEEQRLTHLYRQRDSLVREVHHGVKNHLQGLIGLLRDELSAEASLEQLLQKVIAQVQAIAAVHGLQGRAGRGAVVVIDLVRDIVQGISAARGRKMTLEAGLRVADVRVREQDAVPLALITSELITNSLKHGSDRLEAVPRIMLAERGGTLVFSVRNRGSLPQGFVLEEASSRGNGLGLIDSMLPRNCSRLRLSSHDGWVDAVLELTAPCIAWPHERAEAPLVESGAA